MTEEEVKSSMALKEKIGDIKEQVDALQRLIVDMNKPKDFVKEIFHVTRGLIDNLECEYETHLEDGPGSSLEGVAIDQMGPPHKPTCASSS